MKLRLKAILLTIGARLAKKNCPKLVALHSSHRQKGLSFVTISCDELEQALAAASFIDKQGAPAPHYIRRAKDDDQFINTIDPKWSGALPALFFYSTEVGIKSDRSLAKRT